MQRSYYRLLLLACVMSLALPIAGQQPMASSFGIVGVWRVVDYTAAGRTGHPQPGFWIFTAKHFSMVMDTRDDVKRPDVEDPDKATAKKLVASWAPFAAQFGTYETKGDVLTLNILAAKNPGLVGVKRLQKFTVNGKTLRTEALYVDGKMARRGVSLRASVCCGLRVMSDKLLG